MVQDTSELLPGRATAKPGRLGVTQGSAAAAGATVSPSLVSTSKECFATKLSFQGPSLAEPKWVSGKFKLTPWPEPGALQDLRRTSDTSQQVPGDASVGFRGYIPCIYPRYHHGMHAGSLVV